MRDAARARSGRTWMIGVLLAAAAALAGIAMLLGAARADAQTAGRESLVVLTTGPDDVSVSPDATLPAGATDVTLRNTGRAPAFMLLTRLKPGVTLDQLRQAASRSSAFPEDLIDIMTSEFVNPGGKFQTTVNLTAGNYLAMGNAPDGKGLGPLVEVTVGPEASGAAPARVNARLTLFDYGFKGAARISGRSTLQIKNDGRNFHFVAGVRLNPGVSADGIVRLFTGRGPAPRGEPGTFLSLIGIVSPGTTNAVKLRLPPGRYVIACFYSDRHSNGREHARFGMARKLTVTR
jgi:hypothetical protein